MSGSTNTHSKLSPSGAKRWANCTASVAYCEQNAHRIPKDEGSSFAQEGTIAHDYAEEVLLGLKTIEDLPEEFQPHIKVYQDECESHITPDGEVFVEAKVPLYYRKADKGTVDFAFVSDAGIVIRDLKYGMGIKVAAEGNEQLAIYAQSLVEDLVMFYDFADELPVSIGIVQPRYRGEDPISTWETNIGELREYTAEIGDIAKNIQSGGETVFAPSKDACQWCPAKGFCVARLHKVLNVLPDMGVDEEKVEKKEAKSLSEEQLLNIYRNKKEVESFLKDVETYLSDLALSGSPVAGTKVVLGRMGNTKWSDPEQAEKWLASQKLTKADRNKITLISPSVAKQLLKDSLKKTRLANKFDSLTERSEGKRVLALSTDKRPDADEAANQLLDDPEVDDMLA